MHFWNLIIGLKSLKALVKLIKLMINIINISIADLYMIILTVQLGHWVFIIQIIYILCSLETVDLIKLTMFNEVTR